MCCSGLYTVRPDLGCQKLCVCVCVCLCTVSVGIKCELIWAAEAEKLCAVQDKLIWVAKDCVSVCTVQVGIKCELIWAANKLCTVQICIQCDLI